MPEDIPLALAVTEELCVHALRREWVARQLADASIASPEAEEAATRSMVHNELTDRALQAGRKVLAEAAARRGGSLPRPHRDELGPASEDLFNCALTIAGRILVVRTPRAAPSPLVRQRLAAFLEAHGGQPGTAATEEPTGEPDGLTAFVTERLEEVARFHLPSRVGEPLEPHRDALGEDVFAVAI